MQWIDRQVDLGLFPSRGKVVDHLVMTQLYRSSVFALPGRKDGRGAAPRCP
jgi:hypothetical protein